MSDLAPTPIKSGQQANKNQLVLLAVLGVVLLLALVMFVLKPFSGSDDASSVSPSGTTAVTVPAGDGATEAAGAPAATDAEAGAPAATPVPPRNRNPFDPPR